MLQSHGERPTKGNGRKRKGIEEYAAENPEDIIIARSGIRIRDGQLVRTLVCRFCCTSIGARSDRIREHLKSKRHQKLKLAAFQEADKTGRDLTQEYLDDSLVSRLLPEPLINYVPEFPGKALVGGGGGPGNREMTSDKAKDTTPTTNSPPLKQQSSPSLQSLHPGVGLCERIQSSGSLTSNMSERRLSSGTNLADTPPLRKEKQLQQESNKEPLPPQQLLCVKWENFNSNLLSMFTKLKSENHFVDVTLWCEGKTIKCHKLILSAGSKSFEKLLTENPHPHPIIFLKDMRFWEITALVEFMYKGEVSIHEEKLQSLLRAAESLEIKGLGSPSSPDDDDWSDVDEDQLTQEDGRGRDDSGINDELSDGTMDMPAKNNNSSEKSQQTHLQNNSPSEHSLLNSMNMDLSNHGSAAAGGLSGLSNIKSALLPLSSPIKNNNQQPVEMVHAKKRKTTPKRLDVLKDNLPLPVCNLNRKYF